MVNSSRSAIETGKVEGDLVLTVNQRIGCSQIMVLYIGKANRVRTAPGFAVAHVTISLDY